MLFLTLQHSEVPSVDINELYYLLLLLVGNGVTVMTMMIMMRCDALPFLMMSPPSGHHRKKNIRLVGNYDAHLIDR